MNVVDRPSGAYTEAFLRLRLRQEMSRTRATASPLSLALVSTNHGGPLDRLPTLERDEAIGQLAALVSAHLRTEDIVAHLGDGLFGLLLPDVPASEALQVVEALRLRLSTAAIRARGRDPIHVMGACGLTTYTGANVTEDEVLERARRALREAETAPSGRVASTPSAEPAGAAAVGRDAGAAGRAERAPVGGLTPHSPPVQR